MENTAVTPFVVQYLPSLKSRKVRTTIVHASNRIQARNLIAKLWNAHPEHRPEGLSMVDYQIIKVFPV
jgi:hypothetical protein